MTEKPSPTNIQEFTVSDLSSALKRVVEDQFSFVRLRGEISGYRGPHSSGHAYFSIKDQHAKIDAVIWKGVLSRMRVRPEEGLEVVASGKITTFPGKSTYQIVVEALEPAGMGALMTLLADRRRKLAAEGLFANERKRKLPFMPQTIGVITSPTGAVIRDILHRLSERFPVLVLVWPVRVQGNTSAGEVAAAIGGFNELNCAGDIPRPDVIIVARGGGSLEDLWSFNDETVVRAAAASTIPLIAAVGHETDWTLIDHVADRRAPTPTAAAEFAVPLQVELLENVSDLSSRHFGAVSRLLERRRADLRSHARALPTRESLLYALQQRVDISSGKLQSCHRRGLDYRSLRLGRAAARLAQGSPQASLAKNTARQHAARNRLTNIQHRLFERTSDRLKHLHARFANARLAQIARNGRDITSMRERYTALFSQLQLEQKSGLERRAAELDSISKLLLSLGYTSILARGFALVRDRSRRPIRLASGVQPGDHLDLQFSDGHTSAVAGSPAFSENKSRRSRKRSLNQGSLI